jgi:hypothetical protein
MNIPLLAGAVRCSNPCTVNGRTYSAAPGVLISAPDFDAIVLEANGWLRAAGDSAGVTAERPTAPVRGHKFFDTTLGQTVTWDGKFWRNHVNGAAV